MTVTSKRGAEVRAEAHRLAATGASNRDIARRVGVSEGCVRKWMKAAPVAVPAPTAVPAPAPAPVTSGSAPIASLDRVRRLFEKSMSLAERAEADGNTSAAQRAMRDAGQHAILIARLEKNLAADKDQIVLTKAEVERAQAGVRERVAALAASPLVCGNCGRELRIAAVKGE